MSYSPEGKYHKICLERKTDKRPLGMWSVCFFGGRCFQMTKLKAVSAQSIRDVFTARGDMFCCTLFYSMVIHFVLFLVWDIINWHGSHMCIFFSCCYVFGQQHWSSKQIEKREQTKDWLTLKLSRVFGVKSVKSLKIRHVWSEIGSGFQKKPYGALQPLELS